MKVSELIRKLSLFNPDAEISRDDSETIRLTFISYDDEDRKQTKWVFIEKADYVDEL